jgi:hypothetical protein
MAERFAELHAAIATRGAAIDDSPEHNGIQARFLLPEFCVACILAGAPKWLDKRRSEYVDRRSWSEQKKQREIENAIEYVDNDLNYYESKLGGREQLDSHLLSLRTQLEMAKKTLLEKVGELSAAKAKISVRFEQRGVDVVVTCSFGLDETDLPGIEIKPSMGDDFPTVMRQMERLKARILVVDSYSGRAVPVPQLRQMFEANGLKLLFIRDIEAEIPNARKWLA